MNSSFWRLKSGIAARSVCALACAMACAIAAAQMPGAAGGMTPQGEQAPATGSMPGNPDALPGPQGNATPSFADQSFVRKTLQDDEAQIEMGQLAAQKSPSADVKQFGEKMAQIH